MTIVHSCPKMVVNGASKNHCLLRIPFAIQTVENTQKHAYDTDSALLLPHLPFIFDMAPIHSEFVPIAILSALSLLLPLPWHWRARNVATLAIIAWLFVCNIIYAVDALIWGDNVTIVAQVWCDISQFSTLAIVLRLGN